MWILLWGCFVSLGLPSSERNFSTHDFYASLVELNQNASSGKLEISVKFFTDDLERVLRNDVGSPLNLGTETQAETSSDFLATYLQTHLKLKINGEPVSLEFLGSEKEDDAIWCFLESDGAAPRSGSLELECSFLIDLFDTQQNVLQIAIGKLSTRQIFNQHHSRDTFEF